MGGSDGAVRVFDALGAALGRYPMRPGSARCDTHGEYVVREVLAEDGSVMGRLPLVCPACAAEQRKREEAERKEAARLERIRSLIEDGGIPRRYHHARLESCTALSASQQAVIDSARDYAARWPAQCETGESLIVVGDMGTGKTHLGCALLRAVIERGGRGVYTTVQGLIRDVRDTWGGRSERREVEVLQRYTHAPLLVLDEVGATLGTDAERALLFDVLDRRYQSLRPTLVMGNCSLAELERALDARSVDRLREGGGRAYRLTGPSRRAAS